MTFGGHGFVVTRLSTGIRVGGAVELGGLELPANFKRSEAMLTKAKSFLPGLKAEGGSQWIGLPSLIAGQPAGHRPVEGEREGRLFLRPRPSRPDAIRRHGQTGR